MVTESLLPHDARELFEVRVLPREQAVAFEERDDAFEQVLAFAHDEHECTIASAVRSDGAAPKPVTNQLEYLSPVAVLADMELGHELKPDATSRIALHRD